VIALATSMLIRDGGTIQIGIGELGDAIVHAMTLRHRANAEWRLALGDTNLVPRFERELRDMGGDEPFAEGLYAVTELFVDGFLDLYREGILKRRVEPDGALLHGGFMLGPRAFYEALRTMPDEERALFRMMPVSFTNELLGPDWERKVAQRRDARFVNSAMMATLGGALVSDGLADGRVVSGVGGQYNFVAQAHDLPGGRSIVAVAPRVQRPGHVESNVRFNYGHETIPRHLRDVVVSEYGVADLRGRSDAEVAAALLAIADSASSRRSSGTCSARQAACRLPDPGCASAEFSRVTRGRARAAPQGRTLRCPPLWNRPDTGGAAPRRGAAQLKARSETLAGKLGIAAALMKPLPRDAESRALFERMGLEQPRNLGERWMRRLVAAAL
jgi:hypothetical protein